MSDAQKSRPILALHGSASVGAQWQGLAKDLEGERVVVAPDLPGYGSNREWEDLSVSGRFDWLIDEVQKTGDEFDVVAHSYGGAVAMRLANQYPDCIGNVVIYEPIVPAGVEGHEGTPMSDLHDLWRLAQEQSASATVEMFFTFWGGEGAWQVMSERARGRLVADHQSLMLDFEQMFKGEIQLGTPTYEGHLTILHGDKSPAAAPFMAKRLAAMYPQAVLRVLPGFGHLAPSTHADEMNKVFRRCLQEAEM